MAKTTRKNPTTTSERGDLDDEVNRGLDALGPMFAPKQVNARIVEVDTDGRVVLKVSQSCLRELVRLWDVPIMIRVSWNP